ncbi:MAG: sulfite exporter TauE/SafE family protein [Planctomycetes bacterium]|nr:sulfite exporter TauE/SafE family protein [Planctomycetota bacterium]
MPPIVVLVIIGLIAGLTGGMLGVGGSIVMIPAMTELLGPDQHLYQAAAMIVNLFVVIPAVVHHRRAKAIDPSTIRRLIPFAMVGVVVGVAISETPLFVGEGERYLRGMFGLFLLAVGAIDLYRLARDKVRFGVRLPPPYGSDPTNCARPTMGWRFAAAVALPTGLVAGLLGVGGGVLAVPLQRRFLGIPIRNAIANSATLIIATALVGATLKNIALIRGHDYGYRSFALAGALIPAAVLGSMIGSRLTHLLPVKAIKTAFFILLVVAAGRLILGAVRGG